MIVKSAEKDVSKTLSNPSRRKAAVMIPATSRPGFKPKASPIVTEMLGAC